VHELVVQVFGPGRPVLLRGEAGQSLLVDEDPQRVDAADQHVDAHVELEAVDQVRLVEVSLHHATLVP